MVLSKFAAPKESKLSAWQVEKRIPWMSGTGSAVMSPQWIYLGSTPHPGFQWQMKVYRDSLLKMVHIPGGDWHPGWGVDLRLIYPIYK